MFGAGRGARDCSHGMYERRGSPKQRTKGMWMHDKLRCAITLASDTRHGTPCYLESHARSQEPSRPPHAASHRRRPPLPAAQIVPSLSFSNPFQQYAGGVIPGWEYGGEATLASDYITLTPATPNKVGWVWAAEPAALGSWEVQLEMHIGGAAQRGAGGGMAFW